MFSITSRIARERLTPAPFEVTTGIFTYLPLKHAGSRNCFRYSRNDLCTSGVTAKQMLTEALLVAAADDLVSGQDIISHRLDRHVRGELARWLPLNSSESHNPDPLVPRSFIDRIPTTA